MTSPEWNVFIAYGRPDYAIAKEIRDKIVRYTTVFMDQESLRGGQHWDDVAPAALKAAGVVVVIVGPSLDNSHYLKDEIISCIEHSRKNTTNPQVIFPVVVSGYQGNFPYGLKRKHYLDLSNVAPSDAALEVLGVLLDRQAKEFHELSKPAVANDEEILNAELLRVATSRHEKLKNSGVAPPSILKQAEREVRMAERRLRTGGELQAGDVLSEKFLLLEQLGGDGFAHIWSALDEATGAKVAVKVHKENIGGDEVTFDRFVRGAHFMESLRHPHICEIISNEGLHASRQRSARPYSYYVMEYLPGGDFHSNILARRLTPDQILTIVLQVGEALEYAHSREIIHRDVKPRNLILAENGAAKLTNFDIALPVSERTLGLETGFGSYHYAAPEQQAGKIEIDFRADIYSLGMTAIFALYGENLPLEVIRSSRSFIAGLNISPEIQNILRRAVAWNAEDRYPTVSDFCKELRGAWQLGATYTPPTIISRVIPKIDIEMLFVPGGKMLMGDDSLPETQPCHEVTLQSFWVARFPVINANYGLFRSETGHEASAFSHLKEFSDPTQPVFGVSFPDAVAFCKWLEEYLTKEAPSWLPLGATIRLPTEAEWEYVARGSAARRYPWGFASPNHTLANYGDYVGRPTSVGNYPEGASWISAQDLAGNVWEWCEDYWHETYQGAPSDGSAWTSGDPSKRVVRGGSFHFADRGLCSFYRYWWNVDKRQGNQGFRIVMVELPTNASENTVSSNVQS